jgi:peptide/nickel transport system permease protein
MRGRLGSQLLQYLALILLTLALNFFLPRAMPGNPLSRLAGEDVALMSPEARQELLVRHGLDRPLVVQFGIFLRSLAQGDLGYSFQRNASVASIIAERLPWTLLLTTTALTLQTLLGVMLGGWAAWRRGGSADYGTMATVMLCRSMPSFWIAMILLAVFGAELRWFPMFGAFKPWLVAGDSFAAVIDVLRHMVLPVTSMVVLGTAETFMTMRYSMLDVLGEDYVRTARAKGLREAIVLYKHAGRNALLPVATVFMLSLGFAVGGATVIETVFAYPGMGRLMYEAVLGRDYPLLQGTFLVITLAVIAANIVADLLYPLLDPRVKLT